MIGLLIILFTILLFQIARFIELQDEFVELKAREQKFFDQVEKEMEQYEFII